MFSVEFGGQYDLSVEEVWPDGDAPENPTTADVLTQMRKSGSLYRLLSDWNMEVEEIEVSGPGGTAVLTDANFTSTRCTCGFGDVASRHLVRCQMFTPPSPRNDPGDEAMIRAEALNLAGRWTFRVGSALHRAGLALCGLGGTLDAMADNAGYWDRHTSTSTPGGE